MVVDFDHRVFFESSREVKAGMDGKDMLSRYKQAQEYLKKAEETHQKIMVRRRCIIRTRWDIESTPVATLLRPVLSIIRPEISNTPIPCRNHASAGGLRNYVPYGYEGASMQMTRVFTDTYCMFCL